MDAIWSRVVESFRHGLQRCYALSLIARLLGFEDASIDQGGVLVAGSAYGLEALGSLLGNVST